MKRSELILAIGDDNVEFQNLDQCADKLNMNGGATRITFATLRNITPQGTDKLGLVLWLARDAVKAALARPSTDGEDGTDRQRVRSGKRVAVRGNQGGSRILQKKTN